MIFVDDLEALIYSYHSPDIWPHRLAWLGRLLLRQKTPVQIRLGLLIKPSFFIQIILIYGMLSLKEIYTATYQATAQVFMTAFKALPVKERKTFLANLLKDNSLREDMVDIAIAIKRSGEKTKSFRELIKSNGNA